MDSLNPPPSEQAPNLYNFVENAVYQRLSDYDYWPANLFKLELENAGIYQNFSGRCLLELLDENEVERVREDGYPFMISYGTDPTIDGDIKDATDTVYALVNHESKPTFNELVLYVALCREKELLSDDVFIDIFS